jgi:CrcB protein
VTTVLLVAIGGAIGAPLRYLIDLTVAGRRDVVFPWGTFAVNVAGSFVLGLVVGGVSARGGPPWLLSLVGTGLCGALTTFSTFAYETLRLAEDGSWTLAARNVASSVIVGYAACALGLWAGHAVL